MIARSVDHFERIRRDPGRAQVLCALIAVDGFVGNVCIFDGIAHAIAFDDFAILARLNPGQIRTDGGIVITADLVDARTCFTEIVGSSTLSSIIASNAIADVVADLIGAAYEILGFQRIRGRAIHAQVFRARIVVDWNVSVEVFLRVAADSIAHDTLAITSGLSGLGRRGHAYRREGLSTRVIDTGTFLAIIVRRQKHAIHWKVALHASPLTVTNLGLPDNTRRAGRSARIRTNACCTHILRA